MIKLNLMCKISAGLLFSMQNYETVPNKQGKPCFYIAGTQLFFQLNEGHLWIIDAVLDSNQPTDQVDRDGFPNWRSCLLYCGCSSSLNTPAPTTLSLLHLLLSRVMGEARCRALPGILMSQDKIPALNPLMLEYRWGLKLSKPLGPLHPPPDTHTHTSFSSLRGN